MRVHEIVSIPPEYDMLITMAGDNNDNIQVCTFLDFGLIPNFRGNLVCGDFVFIKNDIRYKALSVPSHSLYDGECRMGRLKSGNRYTKLKFVHSFDYYQNIDESHKDLYLSICNSMIDVQSQKKIFDLLKRTEYSCVGSDIKVYGDVDPFCTIKGELSYISVPKQSVIEYEALNSYSSRTIAFLKNVEITGVNDLTSSEIDELLMLLRKVNSNSLAYLSNLKKQKKKDNIISGGHNVQQTKTEGVNDIPKNEVNSQKRSDNGSDTSIGTNIDDDERTRAINFLLSLTQQ